ncbi:crotonase/enoyl-CoA hydratase family protein [Altererythrobacter sp.]|uniref:crotonase/enoyl-CoA hydratase family protein n=1 Tax=Altererythrobacter sp. TaxID=1872480 RepID=UPI001B1EFD29|nr:crotonase/enoyl-CoA hydratase family protein [Altererythrobacter sp.]MBO6608220.1 crotonase/enoyl-CoA hydratase family protein [Altererythrobacter sp.]MBO6641524.1 crotonase/enoyl-CoA hydratase family protein [Altererythrobacter sp.]MBO6707777.1 crotonase/enoyl-CoA hydratase family protein [Altererythrobacter sp.]MDX1703958.1 crotonase/enoyl-CoA hydratase family protein [Altererythrobacter ishigakiensis]
MDGGVSQAIPLVDEQELLVESKRNLSISDDLFNLSELDLLYEDRSATLWTFMKPEGRPSFTPPMLQDFERWQQLIPQSFGAGKVPLRYLVLGSRSPDVFCFGGDLALFEQLIRNRDREGLVSYGHRCCAILDRNIRALDLPMLTIGLVQGAALGGGFEALLSFDFIVAERTATFGLPEIMFGLFPGMGAHALLYRKLGSAKAEQIILSNETYTAEQMYELGIVHELAEPGDGINACKQFIKKSERRHAGLVGARKAMKHAWNLKLGELNKITEMWADTALELREQDLKVMNRLVAAQARLAERIAVA